ncbi:MAG: 3'(2'),5'-bisphosphate nucleotidase CysQ [Candidatus Rokuibacteriota bacterium]
MQHYAEPAVALTKADGSPLTRADRAAHRVITEGLAGLDPATPIVSEEGRVPDYAARRDWRRFWLVDPLDGTKEFLQRNGEFTVNIALIEDGEPVLGVVLTPALDLLYWACRGTGAWKQAGAAPATRIFSRERSPGAPLTVVESRSHPSPELEDYLRTLPVGQRIAVGSSLKFCWVAEGRADVYPRLGPTMEWDTAAAQCIVEQAGGQVTTLTQEPLQYNKENLLNPFFMVASPATAALWRPYLHGVMGLP